MQKWHFFESRKIEYQLLFSSEFNEKMFEYVSDNFKKRNIFEKMIWNFFVYFFMGRQLRPLPGKVFSYQYAVPNPPLHSRSSVSIFWTKLLHYDLKRMKNQYYKFHSNKLIKKWIDFINTAAKIKKMRNVL